MTAATSRASLQAIEQEQQFEHSNAGRVLVLLRPFYASDEARAHRGRFAWATTPFQCGAGPEGRTASFRTRKGPL